MMEWFFLLPPALAAGGLLGYALWEPYRLRVVRYRLANPRLPKGFDGLRLVLVSDLHMTKEGWRERKLLKILHELSPDVLVVAGDVISSEHTPAFESAVSLLSKMPAQREKFVVVGNAERKWRVVQRLQDALGKRGVKVLLNEAAPLHAARGNRHSARVWIAGVDDPLYGHPNLKEALHRIPEDDFVILLSHSPDILTDKRAKRADLVLCGHTHGGQIRLPLLGCIYTRGLKVGRKFNWGLVNLDTHRFVLTTCGVGTTRLPLRFLCPPEVVEIKLERLPGATGRG